MKICFSKLIQSPWKVFFQSASLWISYKAVIDLQLLPANSMKWKVIFYILSCAILAMNGILFIGFFTRFGSEIYSRIARLPAIVKITSACILIFFPGLFFSYMEWGSYFTGSYFRFVTYIIVSIFTALLLFQADNKWKTILGFVLSFGITAFTFSLISKFTGISNSPFSLSWSEGNRFYDYSLTFAKDLYTYAGDLHVPYFSPGRYALWGSLFLIQDLPIWVHRFWNIMLWGLSPLILAILLGKKINNSTLRWGIVLWAALFIMQGPVYPHLLIPMIILALFIWSDNFWIKVIAGAVISYYAGISRFTWAVLPGVWLVIQDLILYYPDRKGTWFRKLLPPTILGLAGILPGVLGTWGGVINPDQAFATTQPLLLNRLLPNSTYGEGILLGTALISLPLLIFLAWMVISRTWHILKLAQASIWVSLSGFLILGLLASTKIGGGSNLHNLDMFILTLVFLVMTASTQLQGKTGDPIHKAPQWIYVLLIIAAIVPGWIAYRSGSVFIPVNHEFETRSLNTIQQEVEQTIPQGEILFIDQRQLLTFGSIKGVILIPEYEKKYLMDQAMGNNGKYFEGFYEDLRNKRFKLIISDILKTGYQKNAESFSEENNAYVKWVSRPVLEYYEPLITIKKLGIQLLVPK